MQNVRGVDMTVLGWQEGVVDVAFATPQWFVAFSALSMLDAQNPFDRDDAVGIDMAFYDGDPNNRQPWIYGGDHWGDAGAFNNYHVPSIRRFGTGVRFRLRSFDATGCVAAGWGIIWSIM